MLRLVLWALCSLSFAQDVPFYNRGTKSDQDLGGLNQNFRDLTNPGLSNATKPRDSVLGSQTVGDFAVDSPTFNVDATNHRVGFGTVTPGVGVDIQMPARATQGFDIATSMNVTSSATFTQAVTFNGVASFASTTTIAPTSYITTATLANVLRGGYSVNASTNPSNANSDIFTGLSSSYTYHIVLRLSQNTADGALSIRFNNDSGNNYQYHITAADSGGGANGTNSQASASCLLENPATTAGQARIFYIDFAADPANSAKVYLSAHGAAKEFANVSLGDIKSGCEYTGTSQLASVGVIVSAGTFSGFIYLMPLIPGVTF